MKIADGSERITELLKIKEDVKETEDKIQNKDDIYYYTGSFAGGLIMFGGIIVSGVAFAISPAAGLVATIMSIGPLIGCCKIMEAYKSHITGAKALHKAIDEQAAKTCKEDPNKALQTPAMQNLILKELFNRQEKTDALKKLNELKIFKSQPDKKLIA